MSCQEYKSPSHKLIKFFKESRDAWEATAKGRRKEIRDLLARVRDLEVSRNLWKEKAKTSLEQIAIKKEELDDTLQALDKAKVNQELLKKSVRSLKKNSRGYRTSLRLSLFFVDHSNSVAPIFQH